MNDEIKKHKFKNMCGWYCYLCEKEDDTMCSEYTEKIESGHTYKQCLKRRDDPVHQLEIREK